MDASDIERLIQQGEGQDIEFKSVLPSSQQLGKLISAFANTDGGTLILGVEDDGNIIGIDKGHNVDEIQQSIFHASQTVFPSPQISIEILKIEHKKILIVLVPKHDQQGISTYHGGIYVRTGSSVRRLEGQKHIEFLRNRHFLPFDQSTNYQATLDDLSRETIQQYLNQRQLHSYLQNHSLESFLFNHQLAKPNGMVKITNAALLLFAKDPTHFFPQNELRLAEFSGEQAVDIMSHQRISSTLILSIDDFFQITKKHLQLNVEIQESVAHKVHYRFPLAVVREALVNAVIHRDYYRPEAIQLNLFPDRLELTSPGGLLPEFSPQTFGELSVQRNPIIYRVLREIGYVEGLGTGIPRMKQLMRETNLPQPEFVYDQYFFTVILRNS